VVVRDDHQQVGMVAGSAGPGPYLAGGSMLVGSHRSRSPPKPPSRGPHRRRPGPSERWAPGARQDMSILVLLGIAIAGYDGSGQQRRFGVGAPAGIDGHLPGALRGLAGSETGAAADGLLPGPVRSM